MRRQNPADDPRVAVANGIDRVRRTHTRQSVCERAQARKELRDALARAEEDDVIDEHLREVEARRDRED
jgi:hypothetical protein